MKKSCQWILIFLFSLSGCSNQNLQTENGIGISEESKKYWYTGEAEITSFRINQARYGEIREGDAVMIFVTEDFSKDGYTKTDKPGSESLPVLKMNFTKNFVTGIYPYSIMTSTFIPFENYGPVLKISCSVQEWCGHVYMQLTNKKQMEYLVHSYFENENVADGKIESALTEDEIWNLIRIYPESIPEGSQQVIPPFHFLRMKHFEMKTYTCEISKTVSDTGISAITMDYPELQRTMKIYYQSEFPRQITGWQESYPDGQGDNPPILISTGERIRTIRSPYWTKNKSSDEIIRKELGY